MPVLGHLLRGQRAALVLEHVPAVLVELAGRRIERDHHVNARRVAGLLDRVDQEVERGPVGLQIRCEAALVAPAGRESLPAQDSLERVVHLGADPQAAGEGLRAGRNHHELLEVDRVVGVRAAVQHVHHRHRQELSRTRVLRAGGGVELGEVVVEGLVLIRGGGLGDGQRHAEDRVRAEPALVRGPVELDHRPVERRLLGGPGALDRGGDLAVHMRDGLADSLSAPLVPAVAQLDSLVLPGRGARGHGREAARARVEHDLHLDRRVSPRVEHLPPVDALDRRHRAGKLFDQATRRVAQGKLWIDAEAPGDGDRLEQELADHALRLRACLGIGRRAAGLPLPG